MPYASSRTILPVSSSRNQDFFVVLKLSIESETQQLSKLPSKIKPAHVYSHSNRISHFDLACGSLEEMGYEFLKGISDINSDSELF